jgi:hypothetical protein
MSEPSGPIPYRVSYSEHVRIELRQLISRAASKGLQQRFLDAVQEMDRRLSIYPQFGEPVRDLPTLPGQLWIGVIPPLVVRYVIDEQRRQVLIGVPIQPLPATGLK